ncbi:MAG: hypothetical protein M5U09_17945 [Gammaproteobacteria bacterium]|nr:hypothetical protein [Gammaproteobacteria bacterium]
MNDFAYGRARGEARCTVGFFLVDSFSMMAFISALEPLRIANRLSGEDLYDWCVVSEDGAPVMPTNGITAVPASYSIADAPDFPRAAGGRALRPVALPQPCAVPMVEPPRAPQRHTRRHRYREPDHGSGGTAQGNALHHPLGEHAGIRQRVSRPRGIARDLRIRQPAAHLCRGDGVDGHDALSHRTAAGS